MFVLTKPVKILKLYKASFVNKKPLLIFAENLKHAKKLVRETRGYRHMYVECIERL